jgi:hypothetical protein
MDHVTLNFNNISTAAVFLDNEKASDTTRYKLSKLYFSENLIKLVSSFLSNRKFRITVEGELSMPRELQAGGATRFRSGPYPVQLVYK